MGYVEAKKNPEVRRLLQKLGTEVGRDMIDQNLWVDLTAERVQNLRKVAPVVVTGIRFPNELAMVERLGGETVWVERPVVTRPTDTAVHQSETGVKESDFTVTIVNDGTISSLRRKVDVYLSEMVAYSSSSL